jgi:hypothetical protein
LCFFLTAIVGVPGEPLAALAVAVDVTAEGREVDWCLATAVATPVTVAIDKSVDNVGALCYSKYFFTILRANVTILKWQNSAFNRQILTES